MQVATEPQQRVNKDPATVTSQLVASLCEASGDPTMGAQQLLLLLALYTYGMQPQGTLQKYTGVSDSSNSRNIQKLGEGEYVMKGGSKVFVPGPGWVENYEDHANKKHKFARLTPKGHAIIRTAVDNIK